MSSPPIHPAPVPSLEAKIVVLGAQGVGKTSLVHRYVKNSFIPPSKSQSTVGASFLTTRVHDPESGTTIRLQIWDTAGQERFRSISKLYYRGAHAAILCYDVGSQRSFEDMADWLQELREQCGGLGDMILHVVGTKSDVVAEQPKKREVPFERCIGYIAEQLYPSIGTPKLETSSSSPPGAGTGMASPNSNRSSGFWGHESLFDCCHEVSSKDGEGIEEVFRVITRKLVEQHAARQQETASAQGLGFRGAPGSGLDGASGGSGPGYFDLPNGGTGSFRLGHGDKRRSWLGGLATPGGLTSYSYGDEGDAVVEGPRGIIRKGRCC